MINYVTGDATYPQGAGRKVIAHVCNDAGFWGAGFVLAIDKRWTLPKDRYRKINQKALGMVQTVRVADDLIVCNMIAQHSLRSATNKVPIRYDALAVCLEKLAAWIKTRDLGESVHLPRIGCGLAGGDWNKVEPIILRELAGIDVFVYDLKKL